MKIINLGKCKKSESKVLSGRDVGIKWRKNFELNKIDNLDDEIEIIVPDDLYSINISFFLGLFGDSVRALGAEGFKNKYKFKCDDFLKKNIDKYIDKALRTSDILKG
ncbi:TPA: hypothetical protein ACSQIM_000524 [Clostridium perfringens]|uniref:DUF4325 domain-containing protein n=1 Tax=Clostridium perfringens TaxID=1502 RepID=UPI00189A5770|nr:DUF4325 domain-containing protein [Clostridium perfringens]EHK2307033.1 hypothetical protein [Clostridium perfringens]EJT6473933.1 hypothetical protein [Clostridium perfringens]EJT6479460.1 hypothetical protein [Clostridium perfringens]EJT6530717.1 hypothetical protein [Clostridium perfringens]MCX0398753.1 hypothetical protein [Clostridium perfringens]